MTRAVRNDDSARDALDGHGSSRYDVEESDASTARRSPVTSWTLSAFVVVIGVWWSDVVVDARGHHDRPRVLAGLVVASLLVITATARRRRWLVVAVLLAIVGCARGVVEWSVAAREVSGPIASIVRVVDDPEWRGRALRVVVDDGTDRLEAYTYGSVARRLERSSAGRLVEVRGIRRPIDASDRRRLLVRHVTGRLEIDRVDVRPLGVDESGRGFERAANRIRDSLVRGARPLDDGDRALLLGLLIGDDRAQDRPTIEAFRASGLAHLTAVSGQNVAFVLAVVSPLLTRLSRGPRVMATVGALVWFTVLTRAEPSVIRAALMAGVATVGSALEWRRHGLDVVSSAVVIGVIVDPFLVWSVGWWLSIGGCIGLTVVAPRLAEVMGDGRMARLVAPTLGAQVGVLPVSLTVFGWPSAWTIPCNLLAGPVAGATMLLGLPTTLAAAHLPDGLATLLMAPLASMVRWIDLVARLGARLPAPSWIDAAVTIGFPLAAIGLLRRHARVASSRHERSPRPRLR